ncbi:MAG TPA: DinB family protein [Polyangia bacterium]
MKIPSRLLFAVTLSLGLVTFVPVSTAKKAAPAPAAPARAFQDDLLGRVDDVQKKIMSLEEAFPQDKLKWRPAAGVRSVSEAFLHIAYGNYGLTKAATGKEPPSAVGWGPDRAKWDGQSTDKAAIKKILDDSFDYLHAAIKDLSDADLDKKVSFYGHDMSERAVFMLLLGHLNEHMGQEVAYARSNGVVPPWSMGKGG